MNSEIALLKERLQLEAEAAFQALHGYAITTQHQIINCKMQIVEATFKDC